MAAMTRWQWFWTGTLAGAVAVETYGIRRPLTGAALTAVTRHMFRTHHPIGRVVFVIGWTLLTRWFLPHVLREGGASS